MTVDRYDAAIKVLTALTTHGIPPDVQELLVYGNPSRGIAPGALRKAIEALGAPAQCAPSLEQLTVLARYLESQSDRLTKALDNPSWTPRRSHVEGDRNAFLAAANTLDQALRSSVTSTDRWTAQDIAEAKAEAKELHDYFNPSVSQQERT